MKGTFDNASESTKRLNPQIFGTPELVEIAERAIGKRIRQDSKPLMNKLEQEFFDKLSGMWPNWPRPKAQAKRYKLGNGIWYKPDVTVSAWPYLSEDGPVREMAWEVKGPHAFRGGFENLKVAAHEWPEIYWFLVWKQNGEWCEQRVLP